MQIEVDFRVARTQAKHCVGLIHIGGMAIYIRNRPTTYREGPIWRFEWFMPYTPLKRQLSPRFVWRGK